MKTCVIVPSHIGNISRTKLLMHCLHSLTNQTIKIPIYLSISFETELDNILFKKTIEKNDLINNELLYIVYQYRQTSQFRHIEKVIDNIKNTYKYVMFCDDDDTYEIDRVEKFMIMIEHGITFCQKDKIFVGAYEYNLQKGSHSSLFYEYWSYCVNIEFIVNFMNILKINNYDYVIDNKMCDVLFASYLRHLDSRHLFYLINEKLYNYNSNEYSITNIILKNNERAMNVPPIAENNFETFIQSINETLEQYMESIKDNILVGYSIRKMSFNTILKRELRENYMYKNKINQIILSKIEFEYDNIKRLCDMLYQYK